MSRSKLGDFLNFKTMISPVVIIVLFWLGLVAIVVMLAAPKGIWGVIAARSGFSVFPLERKVVFEEFSGARK